MLKARIEEAVRCFRLGNHAGVEAALRAMGSEEDEHIMNDVMSYLMMDADASADLPYLHFMSLKLLRFCLIRNRCGWMHDRAQALTFIMDYATRLGPRATRVEWRPAVSELCSTVAVVLKLGCINEQAAADAPSIDSVADFVMGLVRSSATEASFFLSRSVCARVVEEFGLYDAASRYRGVPIAAHRDCRAYFFASDALPRLLLAVLHSLSSSCAAESSISANAGLQAVGTCLSWPLHQFFEEDASTDESCNLFAVESATWKSLLVGTQDGDATVLSHLGRWLMTREIQGVGVDACSLAEVAQLVCACKGSTWTTTESSIFVRQCLMLCIQCFECAINAVDAEHQHTTTILSTLAGGVARVISNFPETLFQLDATDLVERLVAMTTFVISKEACCDGNEVFMASLDELLSAWYQLCGFMNRSTYSPLLASGVSFKESVARGCAAIFAEYLRCASARINKGEEDEATAAMSDAFALSHLQLVALIGRVSSLESSNLLMAAIHAMTQNTTAAAGTKVEEWYEVMWLLLKLVGFFVSDPCDGEESRVPLCFIEAANAGDDEVVRLVHVVCQFATHATTSGTIQSPAVFTALNEVLELVVRTYVEAEDGGELYHHAFHEGREAVSFAVHVAHQSIRLFPYDEEVATAACNVLDAVAEKSFAMCAYVHQLEVSEVLWATAAEVQHFNFTGHIRGRVLGFLLSCMSDTQATEAMTTRMSFLLHTSHDTALMLERVCCLAGLFESLKRQDMIAALFPFLFEAGNASLRQAFASFHERDIIVESVLLVRGLFTTCAPLIGNDHVRRLLELVVHLLRCAKDAMETVGAWHVADGECDKMDFIISLAKLVMALCQWKALDCFLQDEEVAFVSEATVDTLALLLAQLNARVLSQPEVEEAVFNALELCSETFQSHFVNSAHASSFLAAMHYALNCDRRNIQRIGMCVSATVCGALKTMESSPSVHELYANMLGVLVGTLVQGKVSFANTSQVAKAIFTVATGLNAETVASIFTTILADYPDAKSFLMTLHQALLQACVGEAATDPSKDFEQSLQDSLSSIRGVNILNL